MTQIFSNPIVAMIFMLGGLVLFHELGHFIVGRLCGIAVETFSIGFGGTIFSRKVGHTTYQISWLPFGGYVKFYGASRNEDTPTDLRGSLYHDAAIWRRGLVIGAGPAANFILAFVIFWIMVMVGMELPPPQVGDVIEGSRAQAAGILPRDRFLKIDGLEVTSWADIERIISKNPDRELEVLVDRDGVQTPLRVTPEAVTGLSLFGSKAKIGRAGIALGFPSAVVTVLDTKSIVGKMGITTGDQIEAYLDSSGNQIKIQGFHDLLRLLKEWKNKNVSPLVLKVQKLKIIEDSKGQLKEEKDGPERDVTIDVRQWSEVQSMTDRSYASTLGILDSHLTIGAFRSTGREVLQVGDRILRWNDADIRTIYHLQELMSENLSPTAKVTVKRHGKDETVVVPLKGIELQKPEGAVTIYALDVAMLGLSIMPEALVVRHRNPIIAADLAFREAFKQTSMMMSSLWAIVSGELPLKALGGPILIAKVAGDSAKAGFMAFFVTMALISINLGLVNLFPIPVLDGGQLVMLTAERLKGAPLGERTVENFHKLGFVLVMCLVVLAMYNDLSRFWASMIGSVTGVVR